MNSWARRGARCVCIPGNGRSADTADRSHKVDGPRKGDQVTVLSVEHEPHGVYLEFAEWPCLTFRAAAFRPVVERSQEQDVAVFAHHLVQEAVDV